MYAFIGYHMSVLNVFFQRMYLRIHHQYTNITATFLMQYLIHF